VETINANHLTKLIRCTAKLEHILTYADFKETILKRHKELLDPGIERTTKRIKEKYYFPDYQKLNQTQDAQSRHTPQHPEILYGMRRTSPSSCYPRKRGGRCRIRSTP